MDVSRFKHPTQPKVTEVTKLAKPDTQVDLQFAFAMLDNNHIVLTGGKGQKKEEPGLFEDSNEFVSDQCHLYKIA